MQPGAKTTGELPKASIRDKGSPTDMIAYLFKPVRMGQNSSHHRMFH
ncbi:hypothetical protein PGR6_53200 [Pseudomonas sp. GR 6-02]|nr:hypothetical protein PGR6_53200 [Pseudomonas sp. GR 6-02]